ncbi:MAG: hypothetical protein QOF83_1699 [Solirubrobacteraceae bacterium]|nr:hypothetical protein [Solirubrobacteraceae bacterium]
MTAGWLRLRTSGLAFPLVGAVATILAAYLTATSSTTIGLGAVGVVFLYVVVVVGYMLAPHLAVAGTIALFEFLPTLKVLISPNIGGVKDLVGLAAITAAAITIISQRRRIDARVAGLTAMFLMLYVVNPGHSHNVAWAQGVRLTGEPILLLIAGLALPNPQRTLRWAVGSLVGVGLLIALYGLFQQLVGPSTLISLGYSYTAQVRTIGNHLRSFGTLDDPFAYAAVLYFAMAVVIFWLRRGPVAYLVGSVILLGLAASFVRTAVPVLIAFMGMYLIRRGYVFPALAAAAATVVIAALTLLGASGTQTQAFTVYFSNGGSTVVQSPVPKAGALALNGRVSAWQAAVGSNPLDWAFGRGVGQVGTAAQRAAQGLFISSSSGNSTGSGTSPQASAVDSGYFATVADVGVVGLIVQLALLGRLISLAARAARRQITSGWIALALLAAMLIDALTRASFSGFPTAFVGMLVAGIALAAAADQERESQAVSTDGAPGPGGRSVAPRTRPQLSLPTL